MSDDLESKPATKSFPVYQYTEVTVPEAGPRNVLTFDAHPDHARLVGSIHAPAKSTMHRHEGKYFLVFRFGKSDPIWMTATPAFYAAEAGKFGLTWEPAPEPAPTA